MPTKHMCALARGEIPNADSAIGGARDERVGGMGGRRRVWAHSKGPDAALVSFKTEEQLARGGRVDVDLMVVRGGDDAVAGKEQASDDARAVGGKSEATGLVVEPVAAGLLSATVEELEGMWLWPAGKEAGIAVADCEGAREVGELRGAAKPGAGGLEKGAPEGHVLVNELAPCARDTGGGKQGERGEMRENLGRELRGEEGEKVAGEGGCEDRVDIAQDGESRLAQELEEDV